MKFPIFHDHPEVEGMACVGCFWYWLLPLLIITVGFAGGFGLVVLL